MSMRDEVIRADEIEVRAFVDLYRAAPHELAQRLRPTTETAEGVTTYLVPGMPSPLFNRVVGLGLERPATEADLDAAIERFASAGIATWWLHWSPAATPADFPRTLSARGFVQPPRRAWAKMLRGPQPAPQASSDLVIVPTDAGRNEKTIASIVAAFGMPAFMTEWLGRLHGRPGWRLYTALDGEEVVGGATLFVAGDSAWLGMGAILAGHRRRGGQLALMARRIADAIDAGCRYIVTETGEPIGDEPNPSLANMYRAGFERVASRLNFEAPKAPVVGG